MNILQAMILGIVEGISEFLPISSTAHLVLTSSVLKIQQTEFVKSFEIIIQSGAIAAVLFLYWKEFFRIELLKRLAVAFIPTGVIGYILYKLIKAYLIGNMAVIVVTLAVGGLLLIVLERFFVKRTQRITSLEQIDYKTCAMIGVAQSLSVVPGVSRSASTIVGGLFLGVSREAIVQFSFLLAVPTMIAATAYDVIKNPGVLEQANGQLIVTGFISAFIMAVVSIRFLLRYVRAHSLAAFGIYRIIVAVVVVLVFYWR